MAEKKEPAVSCHGQGAERGVPVHPPEPLDDLTGDATHRHPTRRWFRHAHPPQQQAGEQEAGGVDQDRQGCPDQRDETSGQGGRGRLRDGVALIESGVGRCQQTGGHQPRHESLECGVMDQGHQAEHRHQNEHLHDVQSVDPRQQRDGAQQKSAAEVGGDQQGTTPGPVDQHSGEQPEQQVRKPSRRVDQADLGRTAVQGQDDKDPDGQAGDVVAEAGDGRCCPRQPEAGTGCEPRTGPGLADHEPCVPLRCPGPSPPTITR